MGWILLINFTIYTFQAFGFLMELRTVGGTTSYLPFGSVEMADLTERYEVWRLLTYMFVHDVPNPLHVSTNMLLIFVCGRMVQAQLGGKVLVTTYLLGGLCGALMQLVVHPAPPLIGASAAAFAIMVVWGMMIPERKILALIGLIIPVRLKVKYLVIGIVASAVILLIIDLLASPHMHLPEFISHVGHMAHLGGAVAGIVYGKFLGLGKLMTREDLLRQRAEREGSANPSGQGSRKFDRDLLDFPPTPSAEDFVMTQIDPILDKIAREGFLSLTAEEREMLQRGLRRMSRT